MVSFFRSVLLLSSLTLLSARETTASDVNNNNNNNNNNSDDPFADFDLDASDDTTSMCYLAGSSVAGVLALPIKYTGMVVYYVLSPVIWVVELARSILGTIFDILLYLPRLVVRIIWFCLMVIPKVLWWLFTAVASALGPLAAFAFGAVLLIVLATVFLSAPVGLLLGAVFVALVAVIMSGSVQGVVGMVRCVIHCNGRGGSRGVLCRTRNACARLSAWSQTPALSFLSSPFLSHDLSLSLFLDSRGHHVPVPTLLRRHVCWPQRVWVLGQRHHLDVVHRLASTYAHSIQ